MLFESLEKAGITIRGFEDMPDSRRYLVGLALSGHAEAVLNTRDGDLWSVDGINVIVCHISYGVVVAVIRRDISKFLVKLKVLGVPIWHLVKKSDEVFYLTERDTYRISYVPYLDYRIYKPRGGYRRLTKAVYVNPWEIMINIDDGVQVCHPLWVAFGYHKYGVVCGNTLFRVDVPYRDQLAFDF